MSIPTYDQILNATNAYIKRLHQYDITLIIKELVNNYKLENQVYVFPYPGTIPLTKNSTAIDLYLYETNIGVFTELWAPNKQYRYNIGIFSIPMKDNQAHYMALLIDNKNMEIIVWDSLAENNDEIKFELEIFSEIYSEYAVVSITICSGCRTYQTENLWYEQNIFCHTWSLWFVDQVLYGLHLKYSIQSIIEFLQNSCEREIYNLITIKNFAKFLSLNYLEYKPQKAFNFVADIDFGVIIELLDEDIHLKWKNFNEIVDLDD